MKSSLWHVGSNFVVTIRCYSAELCKTRSTRWQAMRLTDETLNFTAVHWKCAVACLVYHHHEAVSNILNQLPLSWVICGKSLVESWFCFSIVAAIWYNLPLPWNWCHICILSIISIAFSFVSQLLLWLDTIYHFLVTNVIFVLYPLFPLIAIIFIRSCCY